MLAYNYIPISLEGSIFEAGSRQNGKVYASSKLMKFLRLCSWPQALSTEKQGLGAAAQSVLTTLSVAQCLLLEFFSCWVLESGVTDVEYSPLWSEIQLKYIEMKPYTLPSSESSLYIQREESIRAGGSLP